MGLYYFICWKQQGSCRVVLLNGKLNIQISDGCNFSFQFRLHVLTKTSVLGRQNLDLDLEFQIKLHELKWLSNTYNLIINCFDFLGQYLEYAYNILVLASKLFEYCPRSSGAKKWPRINGARMKYLGSIFEDGGDQMIDDRTRIARATQCFGKMRHIWGNKELYQNLRMRLYKSSVCSILTYGSEAW